MGKKSKLTLGQVHIVPPVKEALTEKDKERLKKEARANVKKYMGKLK